MNDLRYASHILNDLIYPGVECSLADFMKSRPKFDLRALDKDKACDMSGFANFICCTVLALQGHTVVEIQNCLSVVLRNASGVGKTFATFALTHALRSCGVKYFPIALYIGLNLDGTLSEDEKQRSGEVKRVVLRRLLLQLSYLASNDVIIDNSLWGANLLQKMPLPVEGWHACKCFVAQDVAIECLRAEVVLQLNALSIKVKQPVVLFPVIDEGQLLDEIPDGARQTLCLFRELQLEVFKAGGDNMLLGIMTGINPDISLPNATFGVNVSFECALHDVNGFVEISNQLLKRRPYTPSQKDLVAKILYPFIRDVEDFATKRPLKDLNFQVGTPPSDVMQLMIATGRQTQVTIPWQMNVPATFIERSNPPAYKPVLGIRLFVHAAELLTKGVPRPPFLAPPSSNSLLSFVTGGNVNEFEKVTPFCLSVLMYFTNVTAEGVNGLDRSVTEWMTVQGKKRLSLAFIEPDPLTPELVAERLVFPSSVCESKSDAFATVEGGPSLHDMFRDCVQDLKEVGDTIMFSCGGEAPVDVIAVTLQQLPAKKGEKSSLQIRLCDARHLTSPKCNLADPTFEEMAARFQLVKNFLIHHLKGVYEVNFKPSAIVTTSTNSFNGKDQEAQGIVVISPTTCTFSPLTEWWFSVAELCKSHNGKRECDPPKGLPMVMKEVEGSL